MRIGIDARLYGPQNGGLGRYLQALLSELENIDRRNEYIILLRRDNFDLYQPATSNFKKIIADYRPYSLAEQFLLPRILKNAHCDLWHFPHWNAPLIAPRPFVVTVHDLIFLRCPNPHASTLPAWLYYIKLALHRFLLRRVLHRASKIIAVSEFTRQDILKLFKIAPAKITTIHQGLTSLTPNCASASPRENAAPTSDLVSAGYFLYVGHAYPHKNLEILLKSYKLYKEQSHGSEFLVLAGPDDFFARRLRAWARQNDLDQSVIFKNSLSDSELSVYYSSAKAYVFPSLYEGFGLPPLEAMARGVPAVVSQATCLPEILGSAALYFDPYDISALTTALKQISTDSNLRSRLIVAGHERVKSYSWSRTATETLSIYQIAANDHQKKEKNLTPN